jgi:hypothetical protein
MEAATEACEGEDEGGGGGLPPLWILPHRHSPPSTVPAPIPSYADLAATAPPPHLVAAFME